MLARPLLALLSSSLVASCSDPTAALDQAPVVSQPPDWNPVQPKDGYDRHACRYPRLHTTGVMGIDVYQPAAQLDLVLRRTGTSGPGPMLAGVELIPE